MKTREVVLVVTEYKEEMYFGETVDECRAWCKQNNVTGSNGEYIAIGTFDEETRCFDIEDYTEI